MSSKLEMKCTKCRESTSWYHSDEAQRPENVKPPLCVGIEGSDATIVDIGQPCQPFVFQTMRRPFDPDAHQVLKWGRIDACNVDSWPSSRCAARENEERRPVMQDVVERYHA